jgi:nitroimidazol reductase NimA-like FMN-containing flavoprotein (pyridoxamine 5'-phosphate oxidase superfamily)
MARDRREQFIETSLSEDDIDRVLESQGFGVVSLCNGDDPYSIPVSFGYDSESVYFPFLVTSDKAAKTDFIEDGATTRFLVTEVRDLFNWRSVTITDTVRSVDPDDEEWDSFIDVLVKDGWFMDEFERAESIELIQGWKLGLGDVHGMQRRSVRYE